MDAAKSKAIALALASRACSDPPPHRIVTAQRLDLMGELLCQFDQLRHFAAPVPVGQGSRSNLMAEGITNNCVI